MNLGSYLSYLILSGQHCCHLRESVRAGKSLDNRVVVTDTDMETIAASVLGKRKHDTDYAGVLRSTPSMLVGNAATQALLSTMQRCAAFAGCEEQVLCKQPQFPGEASQHSRPDQCKQARRKVGGLPAQRGRDKVHFFV